MCGQLNLPPFFFFLYLAALVLFRKTALKIARIKSAQHFRMSKMYMNATSLSFGLMFRNDCADAVHFICA